MMPMWIMTACKPPLAVILLGLLIVARPVGAQVRSSLTVSARVVAIQPSAEGLEAAYRLAGTRAGERPLATGQVLLATVAEQAEGAFLAAPAGRRGPGQSQQLGGIEDECRHRHIL